MNRILIDTNFVVALVNEKDENHLRAIECSEIYESFPMLITDAVLLEIGNSLSRRFKNEATEAIHDFLNSDECQVISLTPELFSRGFSVFAQHRDKTWGLVDCVSFLVMHENGITDALTNDRHFQQIGFNALMRNG